MRILHLISTLDPKFGGPVAGLSALVKQWVSQGVIATIITLDADDHPYPLPPGVQIITLGPGRGRMGAVPYCYTPRLVPWLKEHASEFDVVVVHGIWQYQSFGTWRALRKSNTPYYVFIHGALDPWFKRQYFLKHLKKWIYWPWAEYRVLRDARGVLFTTEEEKILARESFWLYKVRGLLSGYGIADPLGAAAAIIPEKLDGVFPEIRGKRVILFLSRIHLKKGCDLLIKAFASECRSDPVWHLVMAGPDAGGMIDGLKALAAEQGVADRITWTGMITGDVKLAALKRADVYALPSHQENFGISVVEALACGCPVLISNKVNIWREVQADGAGFVEDDTVDGAGKQLSKWVSLSDADRDRMRQQARICFLKHFEIAENGTRLLKLLTSDVSPGQLTQARAAQAFV